MLNISYNRLCSIDLKNNKLIKVLKVNGNMIKDIDLSAQVNLKELHLWSAGIHKIPTLPNPQLLVALDVSNNCIKDSAELAKLRLFTNLQSLSLKENEFSKQNISEKLRLCLNPSVVKLNFFEEEIHVQVSRELPFAQFSTEFVGRLLIKMDKNFKQQHKDFYEKLAKVGLAMDAGARAIRLQGEVAK